MGHNALYHSAPHPGIRESGAGVVHAHYRGGKGIFTRLVAHGQEVGAKKFGIEAIYGESVCNHVFSQRLCHGLGWRTRAVEVDLMPASAYEQEKSATGRVASLLDFKTLIPKPQGVFLPAVYEEALRFFYDDMDDERKIYLSEESLPAQKRTEIGRQVFDFARVARLAVHEAGADFSSVFDREEKTVLDQGMVVIQVWFRLTWPWAGQVADLLREKGYFLGGVLPRWFNEDGLLMQKILKKPDWEGIQIHFDRAKKILEYVQDDWVQVSKARR